MTTHQIVIEWAPFHVVEGVTTEQLIDAADKVEREFLATQTGYVKRELLKGEENQWVDLIHWQSAEDAKNASQHFMQSDACKTYLSLMALSLTTDADSPDAMPKHYHQMKHWTCS